MKICTHTRYRAQRKPKVPCEFCWFRWFSEGKGPRDAFIRGKKADLIIIDECKDHLACAVVETHG